MKHFAFFLLGVALFFPGFGQVVNKKLLLPSASKAIANEYQSTASSVSVSKPLSAGWTWFSLNASGADMSVANVLGSLISNDGDYIKNQTLSSTYYEGLGWFGELEEIDPREMYKIQTARADVLVFEGFAIDASLYPIIINEGWNWIGYLPQSAKSVTESLSSIAPMDNDYIKNQTKSSTYIEEVATWFGELNDMEPMDGYMLKTSHAAILEFPVFGTFTDPRDFTDYPWIKIGSQTWMTRNMAWLPSVQPPSSGWPTLAIYYVDGYSGAIVSDAKKSASFPVYGVLYNRESAKTACPSGWHWPSDAEWTTLTDFLGPTAGGKMKEKGADHWIIPNEGATNESGFTALPGGFRDSTTKAFQNLGRDAYFWSSSVTAQLGGWSRNLNLNSDAVSRGSRLRSSGFSVRCIQGPDTTLAVVTTAPVTGITQNTGISGGNVIKDGGLPVTQRGVCWSTNRNPTTADPKTVCGTGTGEFTCDISALDSNTGYYLRAYAVNMTGTSYGNEISFTTVNGNTFADRRDGHIYTKVTIGNQTWMAENLAYLPFISPFNTGSNSAYHYYVYGFGSGSVAQAKAHPNYITYGVLYNWPGIMVSDQSSNLVPSGVQALCPSGWHLPSDAEWTILTDYLNLNGYGFGGTGDDVAKAIASTTGWDTSLTPGAIGNGQDGNNASGFTALAGGCQYYLVGGGSIMLGDATYFWTSTENDATTAWIRALNYGSANVSRYAGFRNYGYSVRCVKD